MLIVRNLGLLPNWRKSTYDEQKQSAKIGKRIPIGGNIYRIIGSVPVLVAFNSVITCLPQREIMPAGHSIKSFHCWLIKLELHFLKCCPWNGVFFF